MSDSQQAPFGPFDRLAMGRALALAERGLHTTQPNPRVGCVIASGERVMGEGWHERAGGPHAEIAALAAAGAAARGATAYVSLEPCNHHGRTPPCVDALLAAGVARVVYAHDDPNPRVSGSGAARLRAAGVVVESGLLAEAARELNCGFIARMRAQRPWVRVKLAMSLDGRTALSSGASRWITGAEARADVQRWRARSSGVMIGSATAIADDPRLTVRAPGLEVARQPVPIVLDSSLRTPPDAQLCRGGHALILTREQSAVAAAEQAAWRARRAALEARGAAVREVPASDSGLDLEVVLRLLAAEEMNEVLVEAGPRLAGSLLQACLADEVLIYIAPKLLGDAARPLLALAEPAGLDAALRFETLETLCLGHDVRLRLRPVRPTGPAGEE